MHDMYTHTEGCTQTFKDHLRSHIAQRKQSLGSGNVFVATEATSGVGVPINSNMSSAETLKPMNAPTCTCGLPVQDESERLWREHLEKVGAGQIKPAGGPFCECKQRVTVIDDGSGDGSGDADTHTPTPVVEGKKSSFKSKALNILCSACTGYVAKPAAGGFYPDAQ